MKTTQKPKNERELNKKELMFCHYYIDTGNAKEAAMLAGYKSFPDKKGASLLLEKRILEKIENMYIEKRKNLMYKAVSGYERLAFGSISDSIKLLFSENLRFEDLNKMDLFNISEIKKPKDGAMEIKFFDRLRALEKLEQIDIEGAKENGSFYFALENSVKKINDSRKNSLEE